MKQVLISQRQSKLPKPHNPIHQPEDRMIKATRRIALELGDYFYAIRLALFGELQRYTQLLISFYKWSASWKDPHPSFLISLEVEKKSIHRRI